MPPKTKFHEGEKVLCFHGPLLYEAKSVKVEVKDKQTRYYIHYNGWNKNWDEWVPESRVLKHNDAGLQKQKELMTAHGAGAVKKASKGGRKAEKKEAEKKEKEEKERAEKEEKEKEREKKGSGSTQAASKKKEEKTTPAAAASSSTVSSSSAASERAATSSPALEQKKKRARQDPNAVETESVSSHNEVKIKMPEELKLWLADDSDIVQKQKKLVNLPCKNTVDNILDTYVKAKTAKGNTNKDAIIETMAGVKDYFNVMLGTQLLYKFERPQYTEITTEHPDKPMSALYGSSHLLRLFVLLGPMMAYSKLDEKCLQLILPHIHDFLKYMLKNSASLFSHADYSLSTTEYQRKAI